MRIIITALMLAVGSNALAQSPREEYRGAVATGLALRKMATTKRVLVIGAHPDDEDNQLLSYLSLKEGADVAYLSLTRGEGGQNSIGSELGRALGILRTGELLADRTEDLAEQFFTRATDFGFSKTSAEAFRIWQKDSILADVIARVRSYQPDVIIAIFTGTPADGHGQHQASGILAREAFDAVPSVKKLVQATGYRQAQPTQRFATGEIDPLIGRSYAQLAAIGRSRHRSQDMGTALPLGQRFASIRVLRSRVPNGDSLLWSGIDTTLDLPGYSEALQKHDLLGAYKLLLKVPSFKTQNELHWAEWALMQDNGIVVDPVVNVDRIVPGSDFLLDVAAWNGSNSTITVDAQPQLPAGWQAQRIDSAARTITQSTLASYRFRVTVPRAAVPSEDQPVQVRRMIGIGGVTIDDTVAATHRFVDPRQGEVRHAVYVVPAYALRPDPSASVATLASLSAGKGINLGVEVSNNGVGGVVDVRAVLPPGWRATPDHVSFPVTTTATARFNIVPPINAVAGKYRIDFIATDSAGQIYRSQQRNIDYPHIINRVMFEPAQLNVTVLDARFARGLRIGYIVGTDASVPAVLEQMGISVERLEGAALASDLSRFDAVVIGSRAYELRPDLVTNNTRLLDYARAGGNLLTMYQEYEFIDGKFAPFNLEIARPHDRITDEASPVRVLDSAAVVFTRPNRITNNDFKDWVQERSLYMAHSWAPDFHPLLEMNDPGEAPLQGGLLVAPLGKGTYTYTGISFFREIPAGVPGALRLFINLLSMGVKDVTF